MWSPRAVSAACRDTNRVPPTPAGPAQQDGTSPCVNCTETGGCSVCKPQSFKTPDTYSMTA